MSKWRHEEKEDIRNYDLEARNLMNGLSMNQRYELYRIVNKEMKKRCSDERRSELKAVRKAIESTRNIDQYKLNFIINGYKSEMAQNGRPQDGSKKPWRKQT